MLELFISNFHSKVLIPEKVMSEASVGGGEERHLIVKLIRVVLAIDKYKKSEASIEKAARIAGVSISKMMDIFKEYGVESNLEYEDYLKGLKNLKKVW